MTGGAVAVANATESDRVEAFQLERLLSFLGELIEKYGRKPSILATLAEYTLIADPSASENCLALYEEAYRAACELSDDENKSLISLSLAEFFAEEFDDQARTSYWTEILGQNLKNHSDDYLEKSYRDLLAKLGDL